MTPILPGGEREPRALPCAQRARVLRGQGLRSQPSNGPEAYALMGKQARVRCMLRA